VPTRRVLLAGLWAVAVYAVLTACALAAVNLYGEAMLPFYRWELGWIAPEYEVQYLDVDHSSAQPKFSIKVRDNEYMSIDGKLHAPGSLTDEYRILVMDGLQPVVLVLWVPLAWPKLSLKRRLAAVACAMPVLLVVEFADIPWAMVGGLDEAKASLTHASASFPMIWREMLSTGGRLALGLAGGLVACGIARILQRSSTLEARIPRTHQSRLRFGR
jgi:hypothetical protein